MGTMKLRKLLTRTKDAKSCKSLLDALPGELLYTILEQIDDTKDLLSLCLVSRQIYLRTFPVLYQDVQLNLRRASHRQLLKRLSHPRTRLLQHVRTFGVNDHLSYEQFKSILRMVKRMRSLRVLKWESLDVPHALLNIVNANRPDATVETIAPHIVESDIIQRSNDMFRGPYCLFSYPAGFRITRFKFAPTRPSQMYPNLKWDLIKMMRSSKSLVDFKLQTWVDTGFRYPEYLQAFRTDGLPKLRTFILQVHNKSFFSGSELALWGYGGGWDNLSVLKLCFMSTFDAFVGRAPNLEELNIGLSDCWLIQDVLFTSEITSVNRPFTRLRHFSYAGAMNLVATTRERQLLDMLKWMPHLQSLDLLQQETSNNSLLQHLDTIRGLVPNLEKLSLEVLPRVERGHRLLLGQIAKFDKPLGLNMYVHIQDGRQNQLKALADHYGLSRYIRKERQRLGLPWTKPFEIRYTYTWSGEDLRYIEKTPEDFADFTVDYDTALGPVTVLGRTCWSKASILKKLSFLNNSDSESEGENLDELSL
jgi:hypothetical protein